jgi:hypothetical protein
LEYARHNDSPAGARRHADGACLDPFACAGIEPHGRPLITLDPSANTTDVYAFKSRKGGTDYLTTALAVYPFQEPGIGPNNYSFDPTVDYDIHVVLGNNTQTGKTDLRFRFEFSTAYANSRTILQSYLGVVEPGPQFSENQNLRQTYKVTKLNHRNGRTTVLGEGIMVPPNNQGRVTPFYNRGDDGDKPARPGVENSSEFDGYTRNAVTTLPGNYVALPASATTVSTATFSRSSISTCRRARWIGSGGL